MRQAIMLAVAGFSTAVAPPLLAAEKSPAEQAAADWLYPGAKVIDSGKGGAVSRVAQETTDDLPKVLKHYGNKLGIELRAAGGVAGSRSKGGAAVEYAHHALKPGAAGGTVTVSTFRTKTAVATLVLSRPAGGKVTTVTVTHVPRDAGK